MEAQGVASLPVTSGDPRHRFVPAVPATVHLLAAALIWSGVGVMLCLRGLWILWPVHPAAYGWLGGAVLLGTLKALFVLDRTARRNIARIRGFAGRTCIGAVYSWKTWGLVGAMIGSGWLLRHSSLPALFVGSLYVAIGWALCVSSRLAWVELLA